MEKKQPLFVFDLDSTITRCELLPLLAREIGAEREMAELTEQAMRGQTPFEESFRARAALLSEIPLSRAREIVGSAPLFEEIAGFIRRNPARCRILTGNLDAWIEPLIWSLDMAGRCLCSRARVGGGRILGVESILDKGAAARSLPHPFVAVGDGDNDLEMLRAADFGIAFSGARPVSQTLAAAAGRVVETQQALCALLNGFLGEGDSEG